MKVILKGTTSCSWQLDGQFIMGGIERELTTKQLAEAEKSNLIVDVIGKKEEKSVEKKAKVYTEEELFAKNKDWQVKLLIKLGLKPASKEADRVKQILEVQK